MDARTLRVESFGLLMAVLLVGGCQNAARTTGPERAAAPPAGVAPITSTDPCATRLHELCGPLLLYYSTQGRLPERLDELARMPGFAAVGELICPVSGQPYVYDPAGIPGVDPGSRVVIYDPLPSHSGVRWGISILQAGEGDPLITKVIALPESRFAGRGARAPATVPAP